MYFYPHPNDEFGDDTRPRMLNVDTGCCFSQYFAHCLPHLHSYHIYHIYHIYHHNLLIISLSFITFVLFFKAYGRNHLHFVYLSEKILLSDIYDDRTIEFTEVHWIWSAVWCLFGWRLNPLLANLALEGTISSHHRLTLFAPGGGAHYAPSVAYLRISV